MADFGTSRFLEIAAHGTTVIGSPPYMAPEQFHGKAVFASDLYSLGVTMYQMLTGVLPYDTPAPADIGRLERGELVTPPKLKNPAIPRRLNDIVMQAMAPEVGAGTSGRRTCSTTSWNSGRRSCGPRPRDNSTPSRRASRRGRRCRRDTTGIRGDSGVVGSRARPSRPAVLLELPQATARAQRPLPVLRGEAIAADGRFEPAAGKRQLSMTTTIVGEGGDGRSPAAGETARSGPSSVGTLLRENVAAQWAVVVAFYTLLTLIMLNPIVNYAHLGSASYPGDPRLIIWTLAWDNHAVLNGLDLFDANVFYPAASSLGYNEHLFGVSLFTLPIYALSGNPVLAHNLLLIVAFIGDGASAHLLAYRHLRDHVAAAVGGVVFAFSFYNMLHGHGHMNLVWSFFVPLSLIALDRWYDQPTWPRWLAWFVPVTLQVLSSWYQAVLVALANGLFLVFLMGAGVLSARNAGQRGMVNGAPADRRWRVRAVQIATGVLIGGGVCWTFAQHYLHLASDGPRETAAYSADVASFVVPPLNTWLGQWLAGHSQLHLRTAYGESTLYLGWLALAFATVGAFVTLAPGTRRRSFPQLSSRLVWSFAALGVVALSLAFGPSGEAIAGRGGWAPFDYFSRLPALQGFRTPARFTLLVVLAVAWFAAGGAAALHVKWGRRARILTAMAIPLMLSEWYLVGFANGKPQPERAPFVYERLTRLPPGPVVSLPDYSRDPTFWWRGADYFLYRRSTGFRS